MLELAVLAAVILVVAWLVAYMRAQKPETTAQQLLQLGRYDEAIAAADRHPSDAAEQLHRAEALKLLGRFDEAAAGYRKVLQMEPTDGAAAEGLALSLAHQGRDLPEAITLMEQTIATRPEIQEFQALSLAYLLLRAGQGDAARRLYDDNLVLLETRFKDDYTDPDPLLAETLWLFSVLAEHAGDPARTATLRAQAAAWAPGSIFARP
jgi:tetratricopeptide (TPR) repeat protein